MRAIRRCSPNLKVVVARDGAEALHLLGLGEGCELPSTPPELIMLDIKMPLQNGIEVLEQIRACDPFKLVPVVMLTSSDEPSDLRRCYELGANSYTVKPVVYDDFLTQMASTVGYWTTINRCPKPNPSEVRAA